MKPYFFCKNERNLIRTQTYPDNGMIETERSNTDKNRNDDTSHNKTEIQIAIQTETQTKI